MKTVINGHIYDNPAWDNFTTSSNGYVNVPLKLDAQAREATASTFWNCEGLVTKTLYFKATTYNLQVKILGSLDHGVTFPITAVAEFDVLVATPIRKDISADYHALKIQVQPKVDGAFGVLSVTGGGSSLTPASNVTIENITVETDQVEANQVLGNASLSSIDSKLPSLSSSKIPVTDVLVSGPIGTSTDTPAVTTEDNTARSIVSLLKGIKNNIYSGVTLIAGTAAIGKVITPSFSTSDSVTRPANVTAYAANKSINCSVAVTAMSYTLKVVTLTANNAFAVGDHITVAGVNTGFTVTNIDGNWICKAGTNATTIVFDVTNQPTGTTPQTISVGTVAKCLSLDIAGVNGGAIILSRLSVALPGVGMTGAIRAWIYTVQPTVLVDQATFTLLAANDTYRKSYVDLYPITSGTGSDVCFAEWRGWEVIKPEATDTHIFLRLEAMAAGTPASAGVVTVRGAGVQLLG
jgi:hypothetical protein